MKKGKICKICEVEIPYLIKHCPECGGFKDFRKPIYKRVWIYIAIVIVIFNALYAGNFFETNDLRNARNLSEQEFKKNCMEYSYKNLENQNDGVYVTIDVSMNYEINHKARYATDRFNNNHPYVLYDSRDDKKQRFNYPKEKRIYGVYRGCQEYVSNSSGNSVWVPTIDVLYADSIE